jgi:hypothetical protein
MKLGYMMLLVAVGAMLVIVPSAMGEKAGKSEKGHGDMVFGVVKSVDGKTITITVKAKKDADPADKTITTTDATKFVGGAKGEEKPLTIADVTVGARVAVTLAEDKTAAKVVIMPAGGDQGKGGKHEKKPQ